MVKPRYTREQNLASKYPVSCTLVAQSQLQLCSFGEIGFYILHSCLTRLFPNHAFLPGSTSPLSAADFQTFVLVPEVAVRLIMEDLSQDRAAAIRTLLRSMKYGDSRFVLDPDNEPEYDLSILDACRNIRGAQFSGSYTDEEYNSTSGMRRRKRNVVNKTSVTLDTARVNGGEDLDGGPERKRQKVARA